MSGHTVNALIGNKCHRLFCPNDEGACPLFDLGKTIDNSERFMLTSSKNMLPIIKTVIPIRLNETNYYIESIIDNTERQELIQKLNIMNNDLMKEMEKTRQAQNEIEYLAYHDHLTGLPNKLMLEKHLEHALQVSKQTGKFTAVMFLDLDDFKIINDTFSHSIGDRILILVSNRLSVIIRENDILSRIGGDEFLMVLENLDTAEEIKIIANQITKCFQRPFPVGTHNVYITTSIGIALSSDDGDLLQKLIKNADIAMCRAKKYGRNRWEIYS